MAHFSSNAPALAATAEAIPSLPTRGDLRRWAAARTADLAVLTLRGSAAALLFSPLLLAAFFLAR